MEIPSNEILYLAGSIVGIALTAVITFFTTKHGIKEYVRDKNEEMQKEISDLKLELKDLKSKDDLQQQVIDQIGQQMKELIPKLVDKLEKKRKEDE